MKSETFLIYAQGLEKDIQQGVFNTENPRNYCLCFRREWQHPENTPANAFENDFNGSEHLVLKDELRVGVNTLVDKVYHKIFIWKGKLIY